MSALHTAPCLKVSDEQLVAEIANRKLDLSNRATLQVDDPLHERAMKKKLADADEGDLFAEVNRRRIDICDKINDALIYESYEMIETLGQVWRLSIIPLKSLILKSCRGHLGK